MSASPSYIEGVRHRLTRFDRGEIEGDRRREVTNARFVRHGNGDLLYASLMVVLGFGFGIGGQPCDVLARSFGGCFVDHPLGVVGSLDSRLDGLIHGEGLRATFF